MSEAIYEALAAAFAEMPGVPRNGKNPHFKSMYATLDDIVNTIRPVLARHGLGFIQKPETDDSGRQGVRTIVFHKGGGVLDCGFTAVTPTKNGPHEQGSALTYAKRYALGAAFAICDIDDDDGNAAAAGQGAQNGHGRPVANAAAPGAADFLRAVINKTGLDDSDARALCGEIVGKLGIDKTKATAADWGKCIATVNDKGDDVFAWVKEGA